MIYTTYFYNLRNIPKSIIPISIAGKSPDWYKGLEYKKLAPKYSFFKIWKETKNNNYYIKCFRDQVLSLLNAEDVFDELIAIAGTDKFVLVCYEKPDDFCHRHLVAEWFKENGYDCMEFPRI